MNELDTLISKLKDKKEVDAVFLTGSYGISGHTKSSDIDLVIVIEKNDANIRSVYKLIDGVFADIFFFDKSEIETLLQSTSLSANSMESILVAWMSKADIRFDKSGLTTRLKEHAPTVKAVVNEIEQNDILQKISYNWIQNKRYFDSGEQKYHDALIIRLSYSVTELITGFLALQNEPWRGEKHAVAFVKEHDPEFYDLFVKSQFANDLKVKMEAYGTMVAKIEIIRPLLKYTTPVCLSKKENTSVEMGRLLEFWDRLSE